VHRGKILALVPKTYIPNYGEFYEKRHFASAQALQGDPQGRTTVRLSDAFPAVPFGTDIIIADREHEAIAVGVEICEDLWVPSPPSVSHALGGATIIANPSASNEIIGKAAYRRMLTASQSARLACAYLYADAGPGESTTDMVFSGHRVIAENGVILGETRLFSDTLLIADIDVERLVQERRRMVTYGDCAGNAARARGAGVPAYRVIHADLDIPGSPTIGFLPQGSGKTGGALRRVIDPRPFVPGREEEREERSREVVTLQAQGLAKRLRHTGARTAVIGISGGLDSTLALLVTHRAFEILGKPPADIIAVTMPCFGTTGRTRKNAEALARSLGADFRCIPIAEAVRRHFEDIGHDGTTADITYENAQARERTQALMDLANQTGGIVIGTGDLSELALGWATYNGDHISMYGVNASIPKTLVRYLVEWFMGRAKTAPERDTLRDILDTPVSPELLPAQTGGGIVQKTEEIVGPYELHDFFLYYLIRWGFAPSKICFLAEEAFRGRYDKDTILRWLRVFYKRFFSQQFKRSCLPDGAKVGTVSLSPRGDWRMPSDAEAAVWLTEIDRQGAFAGKV
jgi:NAD+ synthase (glutamine-hydrolysing)